MRAEQAARALIATAVSLNALSLALLLGGPVTLLLGLAAAAVVWLCRHAMVRQLVAWRLQLRRRASDTRAAELQAQHRRALDRRHQLRLEQEARTHKKRQTIHQWQREFYNVGVDWPQ